MKLIKAPNSLEEIKNLSVFLAGSIGLGKAKNWQEEVIETLQNNAVTVLNPRRESWDHTWIQSIEDTNFKQQVLWELHALEIADFIVVYFDPKSQAPITLLELGLHARSNKIVVCCPDGFWRKGNVDIVCEKYGIPQVADLEELIKEIKKRIK